MKKIRTVTGDVPAEKMGRTLTHEHLLYTYPGGEHDHNSAFDLENAVNRIATELKAGMDQYHYGTIVDMTPAEVGRNPELMKRVAQKTGANVIAVSGFFPERMGIPYWFRRQTEPFGPVREHRRDRRTRRDATAPRRSHGAAGERHQRV